MLPQTTVDLRECRRWRTRQQFPTEELARHAYRVECDLHLADQLEGVREIPGLAELRQENIAAFRRAMGWER